MSDQEFAFRLIEAFGLRVEREGVYRDGLGEMRGGGWRITTPGGVVYQTEDVRLDEAIINAVRAAL